MAFSHEKQLIAKLIPKLLSRIIFFISLLVVGIGLSGCAIHNETSPAPSHSAQKPSPLAQNFQHKSNGSGEFPNNHLIREPVRTKRPKPRFKELSPLDIQLVSLSFVEEDYRSIFQALAHAAGLNLVIDDSAVSVLSQGRKLTAEFVEQSVREVLNAVCRASNLGWEERDGTVYILGFVEKILNLDFIASTHKAKVTVGGDVLGGQTGGGSSSGQGITAQGEGELATPLTGSFEITGETSPGALDIYQEIDSSVKAYLEGKGKYFLNRNTGTLLVQGPPKVVQRIEDYIDTLKKKYQRQVLIEARIIEVALDKSAELGIDWRRLTINASDRQIHPKGTSFQLNSQLLEGALRESTMYGITLTNPYYDLSVVVRALEQFGNVRTLSNPRLKVLNGQPAMISVGQSVSYLRKFEIMVDQQQGFRSETPNAEIASIFNGILLGVTPTIDANDYVTLNMVPIKSDIISMEQRELTDGNLYTFPVVNLREASTTVRAHSGDLVILGGLIEERKGKSSTGLPILSRLPGFLSLPFSFKQDTDKKVELVIILKINVIKDEQTV